MNFQNLGIGLFLSAGLLRAIAFDETSFATRVDFGAESGQTGIAFGDLDGDGKPDAVVPNYSGSSVSIYRNTSTAGSITASSFAPRVNFAVGNTPHKVLVVDLDGDGKLDIACVNNGNSLISLLRNTATVGVIDNGSFAPKVDLTPAADPYWAAVGDLNGDGKPDLVVSCYSSGTISVFENHSTAGTLSFGSREDLGSDMASASVEVGDIDGDGKLDIVAAGTSPFIWIFRNVNSGGALSAGSFATRVTLVPGHGATVTLADVDGDGKLDMVTPNATDNNVSVWRNTSTPGVINSSSFAPRVNFPTGGYPYRAAVGDLDGDGKPDLVMANANSHNVSVFRNLSTAGAFTTASLAGRVDYPTGLGPRESAIADIDGDGLPDIATANLSQSSFSVLRQMMPGAPPTLPQITSQPVSQSVALGGDATFTVTANGTGLNYQWLFQGGIKSGATSPALTIANATPADAGDYAVIVSNGGGSVTSLVATLEVRIGDSMFATRVDFGAESGQTGIAFGDLDGDGKPDAVVPNYSGSSVSIYRNTSTAGSITASSFAPRVNFAVGNTPHKVLVVDLDGDGKLDIACVNNGNSLISLLRNTATVGVIDNGSFAPKVDLTPAADPYWAAVGDLNGDGKPDLVVSCYSSGTISVFENHSTAGTLSFGSREDLGSDMASASVEVGDIDGDGKLDIVAAGTSPFIWIFRNVNSGGALSAGSFATRVTLVPGHGATVTLADVDGDGKLDMVTPNATDNNVSVWRNTSTPGVINSSSFAPRVNFPTGGYPYRAAVGDLDGDGKPDLVMANANSHNVSVFRNLSTAGAFTTASLAGRVDYPTGLGPRESAIADIDGDGLPDIATANLSQSSFSVLRQMMPGAPPTLPQITSQPVSQSVALGGDATFTVTANGTGLNYQWLFQGGIKSGATSPALTIANATPADAGDYAVIVSNGGGSVTSLVATLEVRIGDSMFATRVDFGAESGQTGIAFGDLDGDGKPDAVVPNYSGSSVSIYRNTSTAGSITASSFAPRVNFAVGNTPHKVLVVDLDGDGKLDIACVNNGNSLISLLRNTATVGVIDNGSFAPKVDLTPAADPYWAAVGDLNGDGKPDLVVSCYSSGTISVFENHSTAGTLSFGSREDLGSDMASASVEVGDIDGDGKLDIVAAGTSPFIWIFRNVNSGGALSAGSFATRVTLVPGHGATVTLADVDGDGKLDMVTPNATDNNVSVWRNTSTPGVINSSSFAPRVNFPTGGYPYRAAVGDLDGDGKPDLVMANANSHNVSVFRNLSTAGAFTTASLAGRVDYPTGLGPRESAIADIDGDGLPDIATANLSQSSFSVLRQIGPVTNLPPQLPTIVQQPVPYQSVSVGSLVQLSVAASGSGPLSFQWFFNEDPRVGANSASLIINSVQPADAGSYRVIVSNLVGSVTSIVAAISVVSNPPAGGGTLLFANISSNRVYDVGGSNFVAAGGSLVVGLWVGENPDSLQLSGALATFNTPFAPGRFNGGTRSIPGTSAGQPVSVQVKVWDGADGATYDEAVAVGGKSGLSSVFQMSLGGGFQPPVTLWQMPSFVLTLPGTSASPLPAPAAPPATARLTGLVRGLNGWTLTVQGTVSATFAIQASTDLATWTTVAYVVNDRGIVEYTDTDTSAPARFYRVQVISD